MNFARNNKSMRLEYRIGGVGACIFLFEIIFKFKLDKKQTILKFLLKPKNPM